MDPQEQQPPPQGPDAPDKQTMDQIRARRLARLGSAAQPSPPPAGNASDGPAAVGPSLSSHPARYENAPAPPRAGATASTSSSTPPATHRASPAPEAMKAHTTAAAVVDSGTGESAGGAANNSASMAAGRAQKEAPASSACTAAARPSQQRKLNPPPPEETMDDWVHNTLTHIFRATIDPTRKTDSHGHSLRVLPDLCQELVDAQEPLRLTMDLVDQVIMEAATSHRRDQTALDYLYPCWKRAVRMCEHVKIPAKRAVLDEVKRLSHANCLFACTMPELFGRADDQHALVPLLLGSIDREDDPARNDRMLFEFVDAAVRRFDEDPETYPAVFAEAMSILSQRLGALSLLDEVQPYMNALHLYTTFPPLVAAVVRHDRFVMQVTPHEIERKTILGPFFQLSPLQPQVVVRDFPGPRTMDPAAIHNAQSSVKVQCATHQKELFAIINVFVRHSAEARNRVLDWFAYVLNTNHKRRAMRVDPREVSSDGFMLNVTTVLDLLSQPFLDNDYARVGRIDVNYFRRRPRLDISDETKLNVDLAESKKFWEEEEGASAAGESNFITEVFFLTVAAHHYGVEAINAQLKNLERDIKWLEKQVAAMEAKVAEMSEARRLQFVEAHLVRITTALDKMLATKHATQGVLLDIDMQGLSLRFMRHVTVWLLRLATGSDYNPASPGKGVTLPLRDPAPRAFACLPEFVLLSLVDNFKFIFRFLPQILVQATEAEMVTLCIVFLHSTNYIKNPYLKSSLVTILYWGTLGFTNRKGVLVDQLLGSKFANDHLLHSLMRFYIDCESTGAHTQFYDKFNIRFEIFQVIKVVWANDVYKDHLTRESEHNTEFFVRFVNLLLNDATYVLDEALTKFPKIQELEGQIENFDRSGGGSQEDKAKLEEELQTLQGQATSYMQLANESVEMMKLFTKTLVAAFTMPVIVGRLASMMNYNLETLVGPKAGQLKVGDMAQYKFRPILLVSDLVTIYLNLGASSSSSSSPSRLFQDAIAADGRCYKPETFERAGALLGARNLVDPDDLERWRVLQGRFREAKDAMDQAELDLGDIPSEFEDPIMGDLMKDPVVLPSKHIVDRSTIVQHLLSDPKDPFTRQPMTIEDAVPATELKERIEAWRRERIAAARTSAMTTDTT